MVTWLNSVPNTLHCGIDGDIILYQSAFAPEVRGYVCYVDDIPVAFYKYKKDVKDYTDVRPYRAVELEDTNFVIGIFKSKIDTILRKTGATSHTIYLTGKDNFRHKLYNGYKSSRPPKPLLYKRVREYAEGLLSTEVVDGQEADDALSIAQYKNPEGHIIASIDKDLLMVPGHHYSLSSGEISYVTTKEGRLSFYKQILTGDRVDDIPGIPGVGPKTASKLLAGFEAEEDLWLAVVNRWSEYLQHDSVLDTVIRNARLLWLRKEEEELWSPPVRL